MTVQTRPSLTVDVDASRARTWTAEIGRAGDPRDRLASLLADDTALGEQRLVLAEHAQHAFDLEALTHDGAALVTMADRVAAEAPARADRATRALEDGLLRHDLHLPVVLLPGTRLCFGLPGGGQVFGLAPHADAHEACLFLEHTFYHELSDQWASDRTRAAERDPGRAAALVTWVLSLIRNEGLANVPCLDELGTMDRPPAWSYFGYADLIGRDEATIASLDALSRALGTVAARDLADATAFVNGTLKNPDLPMLNLVGIHWVRTLRSRLDAPGFVRLCLAEPEDMLRAWLDSGDPILRRLDTDVVAGLSRWVEVDPR